MNNIIGYIPLDDRPCNYVWPQKLLKNTRFELLMPPREILGRFKTPADREKVYHWLRNNIRHMNALVISMDLLAYGGLIASRRPEGDMPHIMERLTIIEELKKLKPSITIYAFSVLMRISITVDSAESERNWKRVYEYSKLHYQINQLKQIELIDKFKNLEKEIPEDILNNYLNTRKRNFSINKAFLDFLEKDYVDFLVYAQEDASEYGFHREEQAELRKLIRKRDLLEKVEIVTGTDELGSLLLARYVNDIMEIVPKIFVDYDFEEGKFLIAPYEDCCLDISVGEHIRVLGGIQRTEPDDSDMVFMCHNSKEKIVDLFSEIPRKFDNSAAKIFIKKLKKYLKNDISFIIADVLYANGGDPALVNLILSEEYMESISSYSALNTTSNSIGFTLAQASLNFCLKFNKKHKYELILERILDDCYYQTIVRPEINKKIISCGFLPANLNEDSKQFQEEIKTSLEEYLLKITDTLNLEVKNFMVWLPWNRTFEIEMVIELDEKKL